VDLRERVDEALGRRFEQLVIAHHRRRLRRIGQYPGQTSGGWATGRPPRAGNQVDVHIDGATALPAIADAIEQATRSVWLAGWYFSPDFRLRPGESTTLRDLLAAAAERVDVRVLAWAGAPLPLFRPDRAQVREARDELTRGTRIEMALDARERPFHCHHEKLVVVDGTVAFVGGIDLTSYEGDRLDSSEHLARDGVGWHDAAARIEGPTVADVADHFRLRWHEVTGEQLPPPAVPEPAGDVELQLVRTVPEKIYRQLPRGEFSILESYLRAFRSAQRLIYLENQFLWSPEIVSVLEDKVRNPPDDRFRLVVLLPAKPNNGEEDTRGQLGVLLNADGDAGRVLACTLIQKDGGGPVYVHAKIGIVDDAWLTLGSANLNEHSLFNDTEVNIVTHDARLAKATRLALWSEHLQRPIGELDRDSTEVVDELWRSTSHTREPRLVLLPHVSRRSAGLLGPVNGLLVDG